MVVEWSLDVESVLGRSRTDGGKAAPVIRRVVLVVVVVRGDEDEDGDEEDRGDDRGDHQALTTSDQRRQLLSRGKLRKCRGGDGFAAAELDPGGIQRESARRRGRRDQRTRAPPLPLLCCCCSVWPQLGGLDGGTAAAAETVSFWRFRNSTKMAEAGEVQKNGRLSSAMITVVSKVTTITHPHHPIFQDDLARSKGTHFSPCSSENFCQTVLRPIIRELSSLAVCVCLFRGMISKYKYTRKE